MSQTKIPDITKYRKFVYESRDAITKVLTVMDITDVLIPGGGLVKTDPDLSDILDCAVSRGEFAIDAMSRLNSLNKNYILNDIEGNPAYETEEDMYMQDVRWISYAAPFGGEIHSSATVTYNEMPRTKEEAKAFGDNLYASGGISWEAEENIDGYQISGAYIYRRVLTWGGLHVFYDGTKFGGYWYTLDAPFNGYGYSIAAGTEYYVGDVKVHPYYLNCLTHPEVEKDYDLLGAFVPISGDSRLGFGEPHTRRAFENYMYYKRPTPEGVEGSFKQERYRYWLDPAVEAGVLRKSGGAYGEWVTYGQTGYSSIETVIVPYYGFNPSPKNPGIIPIITSLGTLLSSKNINIRIHEGKR